MVTTSRRLSAESFEADLGGKVDLASVGHSLVHRRAVMETQQVFWCGRLPSEDEVWRVHPFELKVSAANAAVDIVKPKTGGDVSLWSDFGIYVAKGVQALLRMRD